MRKFLFSLFTVVFSGHSLAQSNEYFPSQSEIGGYFMRWKQVDALKINHVKKYTEKKQNPKTKEYVKFAESEINKIGLSYKTTEFAADGKTAEWHTHGFINDTLPDQTIYYNSESKMVVKQNFHYNERWMPVKTELFDKYNTEPEVIWLSEFNNDNQMITYTCKNKKGKQVFRYEYSYNENKSNKETKYFDAKGKLRQRWTYESNHKAFSGNTEIMGNFSKKYLANPDGTYTWIFEDKDSKEKIEKTICYFSADGLMNKWEQFDRRGSLLLREVYFYDKENNNNQTILYDKKGVKKKIFFEYNDKKLCTKQMQFSKNGKLVSAIIYEYEYYSN